jgi:hypothetical protein
MAVAALVSCNKEEEISYADSMNKTIQISILNETEGTRAVGGDTAKGTNGAAVAANTDLKVLFAKADGTILFEDYLTNQEGGTTTNNGHTGVGTPEKDPTYVKDESTDKYMWHNVPAAVKKIAVVRYETRDLPAAAEGEDAPTDFVGKNLSVLLELAKNESKNLNRPVDEIILYGDDDGTFHDTGETHRVGATFFHVWQAVVEVAPKVARLEVHSITCTDLGALNNDGVDETYDIDELKLNSLTWTGASEAHTAKDFGATLYGAYNPETGKVNANNKKTGRSNTYAPANGAWSWNVAPCTFGDMTVAIDALAYDYKITEPSLPLVVTDLATDEAKKKVDNALKAGNIYTLDLTFNQSNIKTEDGICVVVKVEVAKWVVEKRYPVYSMGN